MNKQRVDLVESDLRGFSPELTVVRLYRKVGRSFGGLFEGFRFGETENSLRMSSYVRIRYFSPIDWEDPGDVLFTDKTFIDGKLGETDILIDEGRGFPLPGCTKIVSTPNIPEVLVLGFDGGTAILSRREEDRMRLGIIFRLALDAELKLKAKQELKAA